MPTPDTETLAARLRAVERALTDDGTVLDPPDDGGGAAPDTGSPIASGASEPDSEVRQRLSRLEAAVQALRAALDGADADGERAGTTAPEPPDRGGTTAVDRSITDASRADRPPGTAGAAAADVPSDTPDSTHDSREGSATGWPDDLGAE
jgi:hypothetical protein